jgi:SPP1 family predicted phage head-tail adaptor
VFTPLAAGDMDQVVSLRKPATTRDEFGQLQTELVADVAAKVEPLRGAALFAANATQNPASMRVAIWWRGDVRASWTLVWMGRTYEIVADPIDVEARHHQLELMCSSMIEKP